MITRVGANISTQRQNRKNNPNFAMRFNAEDIHNLATARCGPSNKLIAGTSMGVFTREENVDIIKKLLETHPNGLVKTIAGKFGLI